MHWRYKGNHLEPTLILSHSLETSDVRPLGGCTLRPAGVGAEEVSGNMTREPLLGHIWGAPPGSKPPQPPQSCRGAGPPPTPQ